MSRPPRFIVSNQAIKDGIARVTDGELHHLRDVRRLGIGNLIELIDEAGSAHIGHLARFEADAAIVVLHDNSVPNLSEARIILAAALIKGPRMDFLVEKAVELGASELWPLITARCVVQSPSIDRRQRWQRLADAAAKQSLSTTLTRIAEPLSVASMAAIVQPDWLAILCAQGGEPLARLVRERSSSAILIACGPEGDFDDSERAQMLTAGFVTGGLGTNRLRSETAGLAALSIASGALDEVTIRG
ncbi:MAG TPA: RsmE family RNA methyltransferase [Candidatus Binataceae bacterium]|nr:RsmE family RNA methyltransferase [Candidatus Binataceae bacterium]